MMNTVKYIHNYAEHEPRSQDYDKHDVNDDDNDDENDKNEK